MSDIVEWLRSRSEGYDYASYGLGDLPVRFKESAAEIERLRAALLQIIELDHHNHGPQSRATLIARAALHHEKVAS